MDSDGQNEELERNLKLLQVVCMALISGVFTFCAVVVVIFTSKPAGTAVARAAFDLPVLGLGLCLIALPASFVIKSVLFRRSMSEQPGGDPTMDLFKRYRAGTIVATAVCEGSAFALLVFVMLGGSSYAVWATGVLIPLAGMMLHFPTRDKFEQLLADTNSSA